MKRKLLALLLACIMTVSLLPVAGVSKADTVYTVILDPGEGSDDAQIVYRSDKGTIASNWSAAQNCQFYIEDDGSMAFKLDPYICPFTEKENYEFDKWSNSNRYIKLTAAETTITALWTYTPPAPPAASCTISPAAYTLAGSGYTDIPCTIETLVLGTIQTEEYGEKQTTVVSFEYYGGTLSDNAGHEIPFKVDDKWHFGPKDSTWNGNFYSLAGDQFKMSVWIDPQDFDAAPAGTYTGVLNYTCRWQSNGVNFITGDPGTIALTLTVAEKPAFVSQDLLLSGEIGVQFFVDLSMLNETDKANTYVTFAISGKGKDSIDKSEFHPDEERKNSKGYYGFICKVNALQMADTITATLHYGDNRTIKKTYSVKEYVVKWDDTTANHPELLAHLTSEQITYYTRIIHALADYGHYVQPFLASVNNFTIGNGADQYAEMDKFYTNAYDAGAIRTAASASYPLSVVRTGEADTFIDPTMSLVLDSETAIRVYFKASGDITFTVDGNAVDSTPASNGRRMVEIKGVKFGDLGVAHTIVATCGGDTMTVTVSALSYVAPFLKAYSGNETAENAICALYALAQAAQ